MKLVVAAAIGVAILGGCLWPGSPGDAFPFRVGPPQYPQAYAEEFRAVTAHVARASLELRALTTSDMQRSIEAQGRAYADQALESVTARDTDFVRAYDLAGDAYQMLWVLNHSHSPDSVTLDDIRRAQAAFLREWESTAALVSTLPMTGSREMAETRLASAWGAAHPFLNSSKPGDVEQLGEGASRLAYGRAWAGQETPVRPPVHDTCLRVVETALLQFQGEEPKLEDAWAWQWHIGRTKMLPTMAKALSHNFTWGAFQMGLWALESHRMWELTNGPKARIDNATFQAAWEEERKAVGAPVETWSYIVAADPWAAFWGWQAEGRDTSQNGDGYAAWWAAQVLRESRELASRAASAEGCEGFVSPLLR